MDAMFAAMAWFKNDFSARLDDDSSCEALLRVLTCLCDKRLHAYALQYLRADVAERRLGGLRHWFYNRKRYGLSYVELFSQIVKGLILG